MLAARGLEQEKWLQIFVITRRAPLLIFGAVGLPAASRADLRAPFAASSLLVATNHPHPPPRDRPPRKLGAENDYGQAIQRGDL